MTSPHKRESGPAPDQTEETPAPKMDDASAAKASSDAAALIDDMDEIIAEANERILDSLGFKPGEVVDPKEVEARAVAMLEACKQMGGQ